MNQEEHTKRAIDFAIASLTKRIDEEAEHLISNGIGEALRRITGELFKAMPKEILQRIVHRKTTKRYASQQMYDAVVKAVVRHLNE